MTTLHDFYRRKDEFLTRLDEANDGFAGSDPVLKTVTVEGPLVVTDTILLQAFEIFCCYNAHYIPKHKPAIGICTGDFPIIEGKEYFATNLVVAVSNKTFMHAARQWEQQLIDWASIEDEVYQNIEKLLTFLNENKPGFIKEQNIEHEDFYAYCGLSPTDLPESEYITALEKFTEMYQDSQAYTPWVDLALKIAEQCRRFTTIAGEMKKLRDVLIQKGHSTYHKDGGVFSMNNPSSSHNASWFQLSAEDIIAAVPNRNNLFILAGNAGKIKDIVFMGGGEKTNQSITFVVPSTIMAEFQTVIDEHPELINEWPTYAYQSGDTEDQLYEKSGNWDARTLPILQAKVKTILEEFVNNNVLGIELDMSNPDGSACLRPVITKTFYEKNSQASTELNLTPKEIMYEKFICEYGERYATIGGSVFAEKKLEATA